VIDELIAEDLEGSVRGLILLLPQYLTGGTKPSHDIRFRS
jgi:hypothetical protein